MVKKINIRPTKTTTMVKKNNIAPTKNAPIAGKKYGAEPVNPSKKSNPAALYSYYYDEGAKKAAKMGMTDRYDIKSYADKYATGKGVKKPKYGS